jgi:uncharacterized heparinase superfamily protein
MHAASPISIAPNGADVRPRAVATRPSLGVARLLRTARHVAPAQLAARASFMLRRRLYRLAPDRPILAARRAALDTGAVRTLPVLPFDLLAPQGPEILAQRAAALARGRFAYLGREADFSAGVRWDDPHASPLWAFNLHYLASVLELALADRASEAQQLLGAWTAAFGGRWDRVAWHPYPVSLRLANLCFAAGHLGSFDALGRGTLDLAAMHAAYLLTHLEHDLRGNHLLENAFALLVAAIHLNGRLAARCDAAARALLTTEIPEQVRADGSHFELSPMYHLIVMQRCLQALALLGRDDPLAQQTLAPAVARMADFLAGVLCPDGDIPPIGDAVRGCAPPPRALLALAERLTGVRPAPATEGVTSFADAGLHVFRSRRLWAIFDAGPVCVDYLPGHGQADSLTVEVWCDGACIVGDPGVHEYTGPERAWGRSSRAHSTMTVDDADTSEVYGSFRVGGRARIASVRQSADAVTAALEPYGVRARLTRRVRLNGESLEILDSATVPAGHAVRSRLHLHPALRLVEGPGTGERTVLARSPAGLVRIEAEQPLQVERGRASRQYGLIEPTTILMQNLAGGAARFSIAPLEGAR